MRKTISLTTSCVFLITTTAIRADTEIFSLEYTPGKIIDIEAVYGYDKMEKSLIALTPTLELQSTVRQFLD